VFNRPLAATNATARPTASPTDTMPPAYIEAAQPQATRKQDRSGGVSTTNQTTDIHACTTHTKYSRKPTCKRERGVGGKGRDPCALQS